MKAIYYLRSNVACLFFVSLFISTNAHAQTWRSMVNGQGFNGQVLSLYADTANGVLYAGGEFTTVDGITVNGIAKWDGTQWTAMGDGFAGSMPYVYWITEYKNELYAGGPFIASGADTMNGIAKWNGTKWEAVGGSMTFPSISIGTYYVAAMYVFNNELYVGGHFDSVDMQSVSNIAKWDGTKWTPVGTGTNDDVLVIKEHNNELYIGGYFVFAAQAGQQYRIAKLKGNDFETVGTIGLGDASKRWGIETMVTYKGDLYAGGYFNVLESGQTIANHIARWDGTSWSTIKNLGVGVASTSVNPVRSLVEYNGLLYVGGQFFAAGQVAAPNLATWDGAGWKNADLGTDGIINSMTVFNGNLIVAGGFTKAGGQDHKYIVQFNLATSVGNISIDDQFVAYPNPVTNGSFTIKADGTHKDLSYQLLNITGQQVAAGNVPANGKISLQQNLPAGTYVIKLTSADGALGVARINIIH